MPLGNIGAFLSTIPSPLGLGTIEMEDGSWVKGFICEPYGLEGAKDVTAWGGWRKYKASCE
jgi:allophanate hydrolase